MEYGAIIGAIVMAIAAAVSTTVGIKTSRNNAAAAQNNMNLQAMEAYRTDLGRSQQLLWEQRKFMQDMDFKKSQLSYQSDMFNQDMSYKMKQLEFEISSQEGQLAYENAQQLSDIEFARKGMENAYEAGLIDMELLGDQWEQMSAESKVEMFERKRQAMKEQAQIRVSQGESGIFGNTALKELANSQIQNAHDQGIMQYNLTNKVKQAAANAKKITAQAESRVNESLSAVGRHLNGQMNGAYAGLAVS